MQAGLAEPIALPEPKTAGERRAAPRRRTLLAGKMVYGDGLTADCTVRDLTSTGARLRLPAEVAPRDFHLILLRDGAAYRGRVQWTRFPEAGVAFDERHDLGDPAAPGSLRALWAALSPRTF